MLARLGSIFGPLSAPLFAATGLSIAALVVAPLLWKRKDYESNAREKLSEFLPWGAFALTFLVALGTWFRQSRVGQLEASARMEREVARLQSAIVARERTYADLLRMAADQVGADNRTQGPTWNRYVDSLRLNEKFPAVLGFGYAAAVRRDQLRRFIETEKTSLNAPLTITPAGERFDYFIVSVVEPAERNASLVGFDLGSDLTGRATAEQAREAGEPALSGKMVLPGDIDHPAFLYLCPVYSGGRVPGNADARQSALRGWVFARIRQEDFLKDLVPASDSLIRLQAFANPALTSDSLFFDSAGPVGGSRVSGDGPLSKVLPMRVAGRNWTLRFSPKPTFASLFNEGRPATLLGAGLLISFWSFGFVWLVISIRRRAQRLAREFMGNLNERQQALAAGPHAILIADAAQPDLPIVYVNNRFEKITGYAEDEILGRNARFLYGNDKEQKSLSDIRRAVKEQREVRALLRNYRKDDSPFWNDLTLTPIRNELGRVVQWSGVMQDVTDREQAERRLSTQVSVIRALSESTQLSEASVRILQALCEGQDWELGTLWILDQRAQVLKCLELWHHPDVDVSEFDNFIRQTTYPRDLGVPGLVWGRHEPVWLDDIANESNVPEASIAAKQGLKSACGFPIASRKGLLGVMAFYSRKIWPLNKNLLLLMVGTGTQISQFIERQQSQDQEKELGALEHGLAEFLGDGLLAMDREGYCIYANAAAGRMLGYAPRAILGESVHELVHPQGFAENDCHGQCPVLLSLQSTQPCFVDDHQVFWRQDKSPLPVAYTTSPIIDAGLIQGVVITFLDVTERRQREDQIQRLIEDREREILSLREQLQAQPALPQPPTVAEGVRPLEIVHPEGEDTEDEGPVENPEAPLGTILLVEEDRTLRSRSAQLLRKSGYHVLSAQNAGEALLLSEKSGGSVNLLITDLVTTHMPGKQLVDRLQGLCPRAKVLYTSVYSAKAVIDQGLLEPGMTFIRKPFHPETLLPKIQQLIQ